MSRTLRTLRASITVGAVLLSFGALPTAQAADAQVQRLAMARTHTSEVVAPARAVRAVASEQRADTAVAKASVRRTQQRDSRDSDGSRFTYDSCGCSN
jgi:hypothetical protein